MRKILVSLALGSSAMMAAAPAQAATILFDLDGFTGTFRAVPISCDAGPAGCAGNFTATGTFTRPADHQLVAASITARSINGPSSIDIFSASLNGTPFDVSPNGDVEFGTLGATALQDVNTLVVRGFTGGQASFAGDLAFAAVPEPSTWGLMLLGFGSIGWMVRRRKRNVSVSYA